MGRMPVPQILDLTSSVNPLRPKNSLRELLGSKPTTELRENYAARPTAFRLSRDFLMPSTAVLIPINASSNRFFHSSFDL